MYTIVVCILLKCSLFIICFPRTYILCCFNEILIISNVVFVGQNYVFILNPYPSSFPLAVVILFVNGNKFFSLICRSSASVLFCFYFQVFTQLEVFIFIYSDTRQNKKSNQPFFSFPLYSFRNIFVAVTPVLQPFCFECTFIPYKCIYSLQIGIW